jgi:hypothetical protein
MSTTVHKTFRYFIVEAEVLVALEGGWWRTTSKILGYDGILVPKSILSFALRCPGRQIWIVYDCRLSEASEVHARTGEDGANLPPHWHEYLILQNSPLYTHSFPTDPPLWLTELLPG